MKVFISFILLSVLSGNIYGQGSKEDYQRAEQLNQRFRNKVFRDRVDVKWFDGEKRLWYKLNLKDGQREYVMVDIATGKRELVFDNEELADALGKALKRQIDPRKLPFQSISFSHAGQSVHFKAHGKHWSYDRQTKSVKPAKAVKNQAETKEAVYKNPPISKKNLRSPQSASSPDKKWQGYIKDYNIFIRDKATKKEFQLTNDGTKELYYGQFYWSPDANYFVALKHSRAQEHKVYYVESSPKDQVQPKLHVRNYLKPGDKIHQQKPCLFSIKTKSMVEVSDELFNNPWNLRDFRWSKDSKEFIFYYNQRGHQDLRLLGVEAATGKVRTVINEESKTFIHYSNGAKAFRYYMGDAEEIIWTSERDGWNHLYLYNGKTGKVRNQITKGKWVVRSIDRIDEGKRQIWFSASGIYPEQNPYYIHYCRINFDGSGLVKLTAGDGNHKISYSPSGYYIIDQYSRVDMPPVAELRRAKDGKLITVLEKADHSELLNAGWIAPERFVGKGRDGKTDIHGLILRPTNFDPQRKYPVIEQIYAGPHDSFVPKSFRTYYGQQRLAELGFIIVQIDGMGTSNRGKAFHDVCYKNLSDSGFPDRILWMKEAAKKYPYMDLSRVGVYGGSAGGQSSTSALLNFGDFYKVAVSDCGCHDNRMDKIWWNEQWMGKLGPHYKEQSNVTQAHKLKGKLFLIVGELDYNVDPASTMQVVNALIKADKDFDLLVVPGGGHGIGGRYGDRRRSDYFVRHLLGVEPRH